MVDYCPRGMMSMSEIQFVVQGDDLGMCHAVNEGIQFAFEQGIVTQVTAMAPGSSSY